MAPSDKAAPVKWELFNRWFDEYTREKGRPKSMQLKSWYAEHAAHVWPNPDERPSFEHLMHHQKGRRLPGRATSEYYKLYRARKAAIMSGTPGAALAPKRSRSDPGTGTEGEGMAEPHGARTSDGSTTQSSDSGTGTGTSTGDSEEDKQATASVRQTTTSKRRRIMGLTAGTLFDGACPDSAIAAATAIAGLGGKEQRATGEDATAAPASFARLPYNGLQTPGFANADAVEPPAKAGSCRDLSALVAGAYDVGDVPAAASAPPGRSILVPEQQGGGEHTTAWQNRRRSGVATSSAGATELPPSSGAEPGVYSGGALHLQLQPAAVPAAAPEMRRSSAGGMMRTRASLGGALPSKPAPAPPPLAPVPTQSAGPAARRASSAGGPPSAPPPARLREVPQHIVQGAFKRRSQQGDFELPSGAQPLLMAAAAASGHGAGEQEFSLPPTVPCLLPVKAVAPSRAGYEELLRQQAAAMQRVGHGQGVAQPPPAQRPKGIWAGTTLRRQQQPPQQQQQQAPHPAGSGRGRDARNVSPALPHGQASRQAGYVAIPSRRGYYADTALAAEAAAPEPRHPGCAPPHARGLRALRSGPNHTGRAAARARAALMELGASGDEGSYDTDDDEPMSGSDNSAGVSQRGLPEHQAGWPGNSRHGLQVRPDGALLQGGAPAGFITREALLAHHLAMAHAGAAARHGLAAAGMPGAGVRRAAGASAGGEAANGGRSSSSAGVPAEQGEDERNRLNSGLAVPVHMLNGGSVANLLGLHMAALRNMQVAAGMGRGANGWPAGLVSGAGLGAGLAVPVGLGSAASLQNNVMHAALLHQRRMAMLAGAQAQAWAQVAAMGGALRRSSAGGAPGEQDGAVAAATTPANGEEGGEDMEAAPSDEAGMRDSQPAAQDDMEDAGGAQGAPADSNSAGPGPSQQAGAAGQHAAAGNGLPMQGIGLPIRMSMGGLGHPGNNAAAVTIMLHKLQAAANASAAARRAPQQQQQGGGASPGLVAAHPMLLLLHQQQQQQQAHARALALATAGQQVASWSRRVQAARASSGGGGSQHAEGAAATGQQAKHSEDGDEQMRGAHTEEQQR